MAEKSLILTNGLVQRHLGIDDVIRRVEETWRWYGEGKVIMPPKVTTDMAPAGIQGWFNSMPAYVGPCDMAGVKVVGMGCLDVSVAALAYERILASGEEVPAVDMMG